MKLPAPLFVTLSAIAPLPFLVPGSSEPAPQDAYVVSGVMELFPSLEPPDIELINSGDWRMLDDGTRINFEGYVLVESSEFDNLVGRFNYRALELTSSQDRFELGDVQAFLEHANVVEEDDDSLTLKAASVDMNGTSQDILLEPIYTLPGSGRWKHSTNFLEVAPVVAYEDADSGAQMNYWVVGYDVVNTTEGTQIEYHELHSTLVKRRK